LWGSASVSLNLWWTLWSRHHSKRSFYERNWKFLFIHFFYCDSIYLSCNWMTNAEKYTQWKFGFVWTMWPQSVGSSSYSKS
jgi:hypothetical protein